jgi:lactose/L-arabinose transport system substrate-binding protein
MLMPAFHEGGSRASYYGGSAMVSSAKSAQADLAYDFMLYATGDESQEDMLQHGLVPAKLSVITGPTAATTSDYWGGQAIWKDVLSTMDQVPAIRGTRWLADATQAMIEAQNRYLNGEIETGQAALDEVADLIASASGLPVAAK